MSDYVEHPSDMRDLLKAGDVEILADKLVSRRTFLKLAGVAGAGIALAGGLGGLLAACGEGEATTTSAAATTTTAAATTTTAAVTTTTGAATTTTAATATGLNQWWAADEFAGKGIAWKHGLNTAVTGPAASIGTSQTDGMKVAIKMIQDAGGPTFELAISDHKGGDSQASLNGVRRLIEQEQIKSLTSTWANTTEVLAPLIKDNSILTLWSGGAQDTGVNIPWLYQTMAIYGSGGLGGLQYLKDKVVPNAMKLSIIQTTDAGTKEAKTTLPEGWTQKIAPGGEVVTNEFIDPGTTDVSATISRVKAAGPDVIFMGSYGNTEGFLIKGLRLAGVKAPIVVVDFGVDIVPQTAGEFLDQDIYYACDAFEVNNPNPLTQVYVEGYRAMFNRDPEYFGANIFESALILWTCIRRVLETGATDITPEALVNALTSPSPTHWSVYGGTATEPGTITFADNHSCVKPLGLYKIKYELGGGVGPKLAILTSDSTEYTLVEA